MESIGMTSRTSQMRTTIAHLCTFFILLFMFFAASAQTAIAQETKVTPTVSFTQSEAQKTAIVGQLKYERPTLSVLDASGTSIRRYFSQSWSFVDDNGKEIGEAGTDGLNRPIYTDPVTGSTIVQSYGGLTIGKKYGKVTIKVTLTPTPAYADKYNSGSATFSIDVQKPTVTAEYYNGTTLLNSNKVGITPQTLEFYSFKDQYDKNKKIFTSNAVPTAKLYYKSEADNNTYDISSYYDYTYAPTSGYKVNGDKITTDANGTGKLTITAKPKKNYRAMLGTDEINVDIDLKTTYKEGKIKTYIKFVTNEMDVLRARTPGTNDTKGIQESSYSPEIRFYDEFGNDITSLATQYDLLSMSTEAQNAFKTYSKDPSDKTDENNYLTNDNTDVLGAYTPRRNNSNQIISEMGPHTHPDDYIITVTPKETYANVFGNNYSNIYDNPVPYDKDITIHGQFYDEWDDKCKKDQYTIKSNQLVLRVHKRVPQIVLTPDPSTITIAEKYVMNGFNRFQIKGEVKDPYDNEDPVDTARYEKAQFRYWFFVPDKYKYDEKLSEEENEAYAKQKGHALIRVQTVAKDLGMIQKTQEWVPEYDKDGKPALDEHGRQKKDLLDGTYYMSMKDWGNEAFTVTFYGANLMAPVIYKIVPWDKQHMNVGVSGSYAFHVVEKEPTKFVIDPERQISSVKSTIPCPSIKIVDRFGADVTDLFTIKKDQKTASADWKLNDDGSVYSEKANSAANPYTVTVTGTVISTDAESKGRFFTNPEPGSYDMIFKASTTGKGAGAYEVIYDDKNNDKMGKLHFIKEGDFYPGTTSYHEVPGINITFGTTKDADDQSPWQLLPSPVTDKSYFNDKFNGADNDNDWKDPSSKTELKKMTIYADNTQLDDKTGLPVSGGFLKIEAVTNGWLYIDGNFEYNASTNTRRQYVIADASSREQQNIGYTKDPEATDNVAEVKFPKPLLAGHTYYVWGSDGGMRIHGLRFEPGFIDPVTDALPWAHPDAVDTEPVMASTAFLNGYTGNLPSLAFHRPDPTVRWYCDDVKEGDNRKTTDAIVQCKDKEGKHVNISNTNGIVLGKAMTNEAPLTDASRTGYTNGRVRVYGEVKGINKGDGKQVMKIPEYYLFVGDMPTYIVQEDENHDQDERISTTNIPTRIWMTFGGWHWSNNPDYPYYKGDNPKNAWLDDEWKPAKTDLAGQNGQTVDGFNFITWGAQNPSDEHVCGWDESNRNTFNLPVRGTYLKFEPEESGRLLLYLCMNGMTDISNSDTDAKKKKSGPWLRRRALYIVDETGKPVAIDDNSGWESKYTWGNYVNSGKTNSDRFPGYTNYYQNYYCDGVTRAAWEYKVGKTDTQLDIWDETDKKDEKGKKYSWMKAYDRNHNGTLDDAEKKKLDDDYDKIKGWWTSDTYAHPEKTSDGSEIKMSFTHPKLGGPLELIQLSDSSYVLPTKGYVRFTFQVYAGKVYYVFMTGSKLGFCGFGFIPASYRAHIDQWTKYSRDPKNADGTAFTDATYAKLPQPDAPTKDNLYVAGKSGNTRLMGGAKTLDVALTDKQEGSYAKWKEKGFLLSGETDASSGISATNSARDFVNVTLKRTFRNQRWAGICLPFTVSETQMKKIFGENMQLVTVDSVMASENHERTLHLTQHANQLLEAGRPYLIYPNVSGTTEGDPIGTESTADGTTTYSVTFKGVTVQSVKPMTVVMKNEEVINHNKAVDKGTEEGQKVEIFTYQISGHYDKDIIPWYSYYMKNSAKADENKFYRIMQPSKSTAQGRNLPGCNIWLYPYSYDAEGTDKLNPDGGSTTVNPAKLADLWITGAEVAGNTTTGIDEIVDDLNAATTTAFPGVYDLQGRQVRSTNNLQGLAPGIYLMGGRKYVVK